MLETILTTLGLNEKEARIYQILIKNGAMVASAIATACGLKRGITYLALYALEQRGFILSVQRDAKTWFRASDPNILLTTLRNTQDALLTTETLLTTQLPALRQQYEATVQRRVDVIESRQQVEAARRTLMKESEVTLYPDTDSTCRLIAGATSVMWYEADWAVTIIHPAVVKLMHELLAKASGKKREELAKNTEQENKPG